MTGSQSTKRNRGPGVNGRGRGREERVGRNDDLTAFYAERAQDDLERRGSGAHRDRVLGAVPARERGLQLGADRTERELSGRERVVDAREDLRTVFGGKEDSSRRDTHGRRI